MSPIKNVKPKNDKFRQGYFKPANIHKYIGNPNEIIFRSSWERKFMIYCDKSENILNWSSETVSVKYINPFNQKEYNYYPDFLVKIQNKEKITFALIEIKPYNQTIKPILKGERTKQIKEYNTMMVNYIINIAKWQAAKNYCNINNLQFVLMTENDYPLKNKK